MRAAETMPRTTRCPAWMARADERYLASRPPQRGGRRQMTTPIHDADMAHQPAVVDPSTSSPHLCQRENVAVRRRSAPIPCAARLVGQAAGQRSLSWVGTDTNPPARDRNLIEPPPQMVVTPWPRESRASGLAPAAPLTAPSGSGGPWSPMPLSPLPAHCQHALSMCRHSAIAAEVRETVHFNPLDPELDSRSRTLPSPPRCARRRI